jgi:hypothetical protein
MLSVTSASFTRSAIGLSVARRAASSRVSPGRLVSALMTSRIVGAKRRQNRQTEPRLLEKRKLAQGVDRMLLHLAGTRILRVHLEARPSYPVIRSLAYEGRDVDRIGCSTRDHELRRLIKNWRLRRWPHES